MPIEVRSDSTGAVGALAQFGSARIRRQRDVGQAQFENMQRQIGMDQRQEVIGQGDRRLDLMEQEQQQEFDRQGLAEGSLVYAEGDLDRLREARLTYAEIASAVDMEDDEREERLGEAREAMTRIRPIPAGPDQRKATAQERLKARTVWTGGAEGVGVPMITDDSGKTTVSPGYEFEEERRQKYFESLMDIVVEGKETSGPKYEPEEAWKIVDEKFPSSFGGAATGVTLPTPGAAAGGKHVIFGEASGPTDQTDAEYRADPAGYKKDLEVYLADPSSADPQWARDELTKLKAGAPTQSSAAVESGVGAGISVDEKRRMRGAYLVDLREQRQAGTLSEGEAATLKWLEEDAPTQASAAVDDRSPAVKESNAEFVASTQGKQAAAPVAKDRPFADDPELDAKYDWTKPGAAKAVQSTEQYPNYKPSPTEIRDLNLELSTAIGQANTFGKRRQSMGKQEGRDYDVLTAKIKSIRAAMDKWENIAEPDEEDFIAKPKKSAAKSFKGAQFDFESLNVGANVAQGARVTKANLASQLKVLDGIIKRITKGRSAFTLSAQAQADLVRIYKEKAKLKKQIRDMKK